MSHVQPRPTRFFIASLALFAAVGCGDSTGPGHIEDPGVLLVPPGNSGFFPQDLVWTSDGTEVVYVGTVVTPVSAWSPDGRTLAAWIEEGSIANRTDRTSLYVIRAGNAPAVVASVHAPTGPPVFSPNGSSVAYFYYNTDDTRTLYLKSGI